MPGLPYSNPEKDLKLFKMIFDDERFRPDQLKIYPCQIVSDTPLAKTYKIIKYKPYTTEQMKKLLEKMKKEAEANSEEDKKKREVIEAKNHADALVYTSEKTLKDAGDKVSEDDKKDVEEKIAALKEAISSDDQEKMEKATSELSEAIQKVGAAMYQQPQEAPAEEAKEEEKKDDEGPIEGEVVS